MGTILVSKDGVNIKEIADTDEMWNAAQSKGYQRYIDVTKDGKDIKTIPATDEMVSTAFNKGYKTLDQIRSENTPPKPTESGVVGSAIRGVAQGATLGFADEITAGVGSALGIRDYNKIRDSARAQDELDRQTNPVASYGGNIIGGIASAVIPGINAVKGGGALRGVASGAGSGAIGAYGASDAEFGSNELAKDTAIGLGVGGTIGAIPGVVQGGASAVKSGKDYLKAAMRGAKEGAKEANQVIPGTIGTVGGGVTGAVKEVLATAAEKQELKPLAEAARKIRRIQDLQIEGVGSGKQLADISDEDAILEALIMPGDNPVKTWVAERASASLGGNIDGKQLTRLLSKDSTERLAARQADPRDLAESLVPEFQKAKGLFEEARTSRFNELQDIARQSFEGDTDALVGSLDQIIAQTKQYKSVPAGVVNIIEDAKMLATTGDNAFDSLQRARKFLDNNINWQNPSQNPGDTFLRQARGQIDEMLKASEGKIQADKMFKSSKELEGKFFDPTEFKGPTGEYEIDSSKIKKLLGNTDAAARFKGQIDTLEEFANAEGMPEALKTQAKALSEKLKGSLNQMELKRDLGAFRQSQGPSSPAIARLESLGGGGERVAQAVKDPQGFMNNVDQFNAVVQRKLGKPLTELEGKERSAALKMFTWINKNPNSGPEQTEKMWKQFLK